MPAPVRSFIENDELAVAACTCGSDRKSVKVPRLAISPEYVSSAKSIKGAALSRIAPEKALQAAILVRYLSVKSLRLRLAIARALASVLISRGSYVIHKRI